MHVSWRRIATVVLLLATARGLPAWAADCTVGALQWSADGSTLDCAVGDSVAVRWLRVDPTTGAVTAREPRVSDPSWNPVTRCVVARDDFGVHEITLAPPQPRPLVFLPALSNLFLRALGGDAQGGLLLWTIARDVGTHAFWQRRGGVLEVLPGAGTGAEALRWWDAHNVARPFAAAGGQFARSTCVQRAGGDRRLCVERLDRERGAPVFRLVLAEAGRASVVLDRCVPAALAVNADSTVAVVELFEEPDDAGNSDVLSLWSSDFETATRVAETLLERALPTATRHRAWVHWLGSTECLWVDSAGQLLRVQSAPPGATVLVRRGPTPAVPAWKPPRDGEEGARVQAPDGSVAFTRHRRTENGLQSEIWLVPPGASPRLLLPVWEQVQPVSVP